MPLNSRTISASEDIVPPTPASVSNSRPQSSLFTFDEGEIQLNTAIDDEAERRRQEAINSITNDLIAISNTPQFQDVSQSKPLIFQTVSRQLLTSKPIFESFLHQTPILSTKKTLIVG